MGVPVISLSGRRHASRVGLSLLSRVGLGDLSAPSEEGYIAAAVALADDRSRRRTLRRELRERLQNSPLGDPGRLCRGLEDAYEDAFRSL